MEKCKRDTKNIYIATYNFNFRDKYERTFYKELSTLANLGVDVNLLYAKMNFSNENKLEIEEIFRSFVLCAELPRNHSKLFITDNFAFLGSANFTFGSNSNYESGVIFTNKDIIFEMKKYYGEELLENSDFTNVPEYFDPFDCLPNVLRSVKKMSKIEKKENLYVDEVYHYMTDLRFLDSLENDLEKLGYPVPAHFNWWPFYEQLYEKTEVSKSDFLNFGSVKVCC